MSKHSCCECKWCHSFFDNGNRNIYICAFDQSENYLQEVGLCVEDCELDDYGEELWQISHGRYDYDEVKDDE